MSGYKAGTWVRAHEAAAVLAGAIGEQGGTDINVDLLVAGLSFAGGTAWKRVLERDFACELQNDESYKSMLPKNHMYYRKRGQEVRFGVQEGGRRQ